MTIPKYTDPAVQNRAQDNATDHVDAIHQKIDQPGRSKNKDNKPDDKRKGYREGNRDDSITEGGEDNEQRVKQGKNYGKRL